MAGIRVQGKARRSGAAAPAGGAVPPAPRLVDVVRGAVVAPRAAVVPAVHREHSRWRSQHPVADADPPLPRRSAAPRSSRLLPVSIHDAGRTPADRPLVDPRAAGDLLRAGAPPLIGPADGQSVEHRLPAAGSGRIVRVTGGNSAGPALTPLPSSGSSR